MGENGTKIIRTQKYQPPTDSNHRFNTAPNLLETDLSADVSNQKWRETSVTSGLAKAGCI